MSSTPPFANVSSRTVLVKPAGPHQCAIASGSAHADQIAPGLAGIVRETRRSGCPHSALMSRWYAASRPPEAKDRMLQVRLTTVPARENRR